MLSKIVGLASARAATLWAAAAILVAVPAMPVAAQGIWTLEPAARIEFQAVSAQSTTRDEDLVVEGEALSVRGQASLGDDTRLLFRRPTMPSLDGNTVELAREQVAIAENAVAYSATLSFVQGKVNTITRALKGE